MSELAIVCDNCGAKYRLPASFSGDKAKCKQCGSVIDVAAQRASASAPQKPASVAAAKPASAAPAATERSRRSAREEQPAASEPKSRRGDRAKKNEDDGAAAGGRGKRGERAEREPKKSNSMLLVGGGVGALAIVAVIVVLSMNGKKDTPAPQQQQQAQAPSPQKSEPPAVTPTPASPAATPADNKVPAAAPAATPVKSPEPAKDAAPATQPAGTPSAADATAKAAASDAAAAPAAGEHKEVWERNKTTSLADVFDPKTLGDVAWPGDIADDKKAEIRGLIADIVSGGRASITAKPKVEKFGYDAIFGLVERLRQLDYKSSDEMMTGWELNKLLEAICAGMNTGYAAVQVGEDVDPRKADHNAKTNKAWAQLLTKFPSKEAFTTWRTDRLQKGLDKAK